jgi:deoxyhypusine synthase
MLEKVVKDIKLSENMKLSEILEYYKESGGFTSAKLGTAEDILIRMFKDKNTTRFLSFPADIISTGTRGVIKELVKRKLVDVIITTCGMLDHDLARSFKSYYHGSFMLDDAMLYQKGINRLGNVLIPNDSYGLIIESKMQDFLESVTAAKKRWGVRELVYELGKYINNKDSILYWASKNNIPVFVPGITDGAVGSQLWSFWERNRDFSIDLLLDEHELSDYIFSAKKTGALMVGGGISKHHTIWWNQFKGGLDYAVYITTAEEYDGSLSGARLREAVSWGKIKAKAKYITVEGDATIILPILVGSIISKLR